MFSEKDINKIENLISADCKIIGKIHGSGLLKIDGTIEGDVLWEDNVILDSSSVCKGNISCKNAIVNGTVEGNVICEESLLIQNCGKIFGDINVTKLVIDEGGKLNGKCNIVPKI
ncbi:MULTISPECIES: bactofilin family protein [Clostridium]|uniref:Polymer-forming cytoskeletal n=2 Tax=Clostridium TaxID=1485 RepID=A0A151APC0_9CLOT|nr:MULTISPECIES: polymer-forming cytoskeletal protein [Clostridium]KYH29237.1 polymer-forming cytoskeletal [Clostridium colicanis DSM 13634]MBE6042933.1 polymer-forming cytoskeletal protein [Clostridium thermopalmarium]PRR71048.1 Polymer-forming cytoskeletal [Clostridium thermopalmarium DSM 5974]PVZ23613.1 cytoskeletal protein CcmA (bactofilin family) [Clostridium thermopalmarium DSM 5974]